MEITMKFSIPQESDQFEIAREGWRFKATLENLERLLEEAQISGGVYTPVEMRRMLQQARADAGFETLSE